MMLFFYTENIVQVNKTKICGWVRVRMRVLLFINTGGWFVHFCCDSIFFLLKQNVQQAI